MGEGEKTLDAATASGTRAEKKPWHKPALRKISPAGDLAALFEAMSDRPPGKPRRRFQSAA